MPSVHSSALYWREKHLPDRAVSPARDKAGSGAVAAIDTLQEE